MNITAIIPAYNEEKTIEDVIRAVQEVDMIKNIIVVSDGSTDSTAGRARAMGVNVIDLVSNVGKGGAMKAGIDKCNSEIILFLDADLLGLTKNHVISLLEPVVEDKADMTIGVFSNGRFATDLAQKLVPYLSGQRALKRDLIDNIPNMDITRYGVEVALTTCIDKGNIRIQEVELNDMTHCMKEEKLGLVRGFAARIKMYWDIVKCLKMARIK